ncbi:MAG: glycosyltransferase, partial [Flavobacteriales bacterium]|nr:glycosyltransferase [Flavobacteriales bacterium]
EELKGSLWTTDIEHEGIHIHPLPQLYPTVLFKRPLNSLWEKIAYRFWSVVLPLFCSGNPLDKMVLWRGQLLRKASALIREHGIGHVIVTGAPFRGMAIALELKKRHHVRLVCDFRDPWTWLESAYGQSRLSPERMDHERNLERSVVEGCDLCISPHPSVIDHLQRAYPEHAAKCVRVPHAIDPDELGEVTTDKDPDRLRFIYAGSMYGAEEAERYFDSLLEGLRKLQEIDAGTAARFVLDLYITGHGTELYKRKVEQQGLQQLVHFHAPIPARELFPLVAKAHGVLIFIPSFNKDLLGTKFTEIFYLRIPVIHVGDEGEVSRYIKDHQLGRSIRVENLAAELPELLQHFDRLQIDTGHDLSHHLLDHITQEFLDRVLLIDGARSDKS